MTIKIGTSGSDTIDDTDSNDLIITGRGDDVVHSTGGNDIVLLGRGNDVVVTNLAANINKTNSFDFYFGGSGQDKIIIDLAGTHDPDVYRDAFNYAFEQYQNRCHSYFYDLGAGVREYFAKENITGLDADFHMYISSFEEIGFAGENLPPTAITLTGSSVDENSPSGTEVGVLGTVDPDVGDTFTYTLTDPSGNFELDGNRLILSGAASLDCETTQNYEIEIESTDSGGNSITRGFIIDVNDLNDNPVIIIDDDSSSNTVVENAVNGTVVGVTALGTDADVSSTAITYDITDDDSGGAFAIDENSGVVTVADGSLLDYETATSHTITVEAAF